jgi:hypothetical protein
MADATRSDGGHRAVEWTTLAARPEIQRVITVDAADDAPMIRVNRQLGSRTMKSAASTEADIEAPATRLV